MKCWSLPGDELDQMAGEDTEQTGQTETYSKYSIVLLGIYDRLTCHRDYQLPPPTELQPAQEDGDILSEWPTLLRQLT